MNVVVQRDIQCRAGGRLNSLSQHSAPVSRNGSPASLGYLGLLYRVLSYCLRQRYRRSIDKLFITSQPLFIDNKTLRSP